MFKFKATYYNEVDGNEVYEQGFIPGSHHSEALKILSEYFGDENLTRVELECISEFDLLLIKDYSMLETIAKENKD